MVYLILFVPKVQKWLSGKTADYIENQIGTKVEIGGIYLSYPNGVSIEKVYLEDQQSDTLLYTGLLDVSIDYFALLHGEVEISEVNLANATANISVNKDTVFNFDYIINSFVSDTATQAPADTSTSTMDIDLGTVNLRNVKFSYFSEPDGMSTAFNIGNLLLEVDEFDLNNQVYIADNITIEDTKGELDIFKLVPSTETDTTEINMTVGTKNLTVKNVDFKFSDQPTELNLAANVGLLKATAEPISLASYQVNLDKILLENSTVDFSMKSDTTATEVGTNEESGEIWKIALNEIQSNNLTFNYDDKTYVPTPNVVDFSHLGITLNELSANSIYFNGIDDLGANITQLSANEKSGFKLYNTNVGLEMTNNLIEVKPLQLNTNYSSFNAPTKLEFTSIESISENIGSLQLKSTFNNTKIGLGDLSFFSPEVLKEIPIKNPKNQTFNVTGSVNGAVNNLNFNKLTVVNNANKIKLNGVIAGLPEVENLKYDLNTIYFSSTEKSLRALLSDSLLPTALNLPKKLELNANAKGNTQNLSTKLELTTSLGNLQAKGLAKNLKDSVNAAYNFKINLPSFALGTFLNDSLLGNIGFEGKIEGTGLTIETANVELDARVKDFDYNNYRYSDLSINGKFENQTFGGEMHMNDSNLVFDFNGIAKLDSTLPKFDFVLNLEGADLQNLGFYNEDLRLRGKLDIDLEGNNLENLNGGFEIRDVLVIKNEKQYAVDSLLFISIIDTNYTDISIKSNLLDAEFKGKIKLADLATTFQNHFDQYLGKRNDAITTGKQDFKFDISLHDPDLLTEVILPDLSKFETGDINGAFNSETDQLDINMYFSRIIYSDLVIDSLYFISKSDAEKMNADLNVKRIGYDTLAINNISFSNTLQNNKLVSYFKIVDDSAKAQLQIAGELSSDNNNYKFQLFEKEQIINYDYWQTNPNNEIVFAENLQVNNVTLSHENEKIQLQSKGEYLEAGLTNFELENIFDLIQRNNTQANTFGLLIKEASEKAKEQNDSLTLDTMKPILSGELNAKLNLPMAENAMLNGDLSIDQIEVQGIAIGNLTASAETVNTNQTKITTSLKGKGNKFNADGVLGEDLTQFDLNIEKLKLKTIEAFSQGQLVNSSGFLSGNANYSTGANSTSASGEIQFNDIQFKSTFLGEEYHFKNEKISFNNDKIIFNKFTVLDSANQSFKINGNIGLSEIANPTFNLSVKSDNFQFLNTSKADENDLFYGKVFISADIDLTGNLQKPKVRSSVSLNKGTDISFVVPSTEAASVNHEGIVKFVDKDNGLPALLREDKTIDTIKTDFEGVDLEAFININEQTKVTIVIDPITGDRLLVKGGGKIKTNIDVAGNISMNGIYEIKEGDYELRLYNLVRRRFDLVPSSKIIWNGDPLQATMDIEGMYTAKAAPIDLLGSQISNLNAAEQQQYKSKLPFEVILYIDGKIMEPIISFEIDLPDDEKGALGGVVLAKLQEINQDESELNKQVFSLIVLKRFFSQDPFSSGGAGSNAARQSVSQLLNQQLNSLTDKYVKGVEIELNVDSYEDYGDDGELQGRTDLNVALSKQFLNDRVKVRVNGDFGVENNQSNSSGIAGDVSVEYKITEDGRYSIKFYRDNKYAGFIEGQLVETGVSLIFTRDYQRLKDLFKKPEDIEEEDEE